MPEPGTKFGPHGQLVAAFLDEVASKEVDWEAHARRAKNERASKAVDALTTVPWPAAVLAAVDKAGLRTCAELGLTSADFASPFTFPRVKNSILSASKAIAAGDKLGDEHRCALLEPFVDAGFDSAARALEQGSGS